MSMIVTTVTPNGIVMAADSACSMLTVIDMESLLRGNVGAAIKNCLDGNIRIDGRRNNEIGRKVTSRSFQKLHLVGSNIAVGCGNEIIARNTGLPIQPDFEHFCNSNHFDNPKSAAEALLKCLYEIDPTLGAVFHVCGYNFERKIPTPEFWHVSVSEKVAIPVAVNGRGGICFSGANNYFSQYKQQIDNNMIHYTMQDAIDVSVFAIEMSAKLERFIELEERIAPPIDVLAITQAGIEWVSRKKLEA